MKYLILVFIISLLPFQTMAIDQIKKGDPSPQDGYVITPDEEKGVRKLHEEKVKLEELNVLYEEKNKIQEERVKVYKDYMDDTKDLKPLGSWEKVGYIGLGVILSIITIRTATKVMERK